MSDLEISSQKIKYFNMIYKYIIITINNIFYKMQMHNVQQMRTNKIKNKKHDFK